MRIRYLHKHIRPVFCGVAAFSIGSGVCQMDHAASATGSATIQPEPINLLAPAQPKVAPMKTTIQKIRNNFKRWWRSVGAHFRAIRRAAYLLCLFSPVAAAYPIAMASKGTAIEQCWWDAVLWTIQQASPTVIKFTQVNLLSLHIPFLSSSVVLICC